MRKLILKILLFVLPLIIGLLWLPLDRRLYFQGMKSDCMNQAIWIYDRIFNNPKPIDIVFMGTSHTINGINDSLIESNLASQNFKVVNFGYCRIGNNLEYVFLKEAVKTKKVKALVLEVREEEDRFGHPVFSYLAESEDVINAPPFINNRLFDDYYKHAYYKLEVIRNSILLNNENEMVRMDPFGFSASTEAASANVLNKFKEGNSVITDRKKNWNYNLLMNYPRIYLKKISELCKVQGIKMYFIYLPSYGAGSKQPMEMLNYLNYGKVLIPSPGILDDMTNWHDEAHLNKKGANQLSNWIAGEIIN